MKEGWEKVGKLCRIRTGKLDANASNPNGVYPFFTCSKDPLRINSFSYDCECVLIAGNGDLNVKYYNGKFDAYQRTYILEKKEGQSISIPYLFHFFNNYVDTLREHSIGGVIKYIKLGDLTEAQIPLPSLFEQQSIVAELDKINEIIDLKKAQLKDLDLLAQSIFYDMFGDPIENPKGWEVKKLGDVCSAQNGLVNPKEEPYNKMYHVGPANIVSNTGEIIELKTAEEENLKSGKYLFEPGMVLYSKIRPNLNKVALATFVGICSADMYPLICGDDIEPLFLLSTLNHQHFLKYAVENSGRANIPKINREALFAYNIMLPPLSLQQSFAEKIQAIESQKSAIKQSLAEVETLLASRMDYYFN